MFDPVLPSYSHPMPSPRRTRVRHHRPLSSGVRSWTKASYHIHLWGGVVTALAVTVIAVTGILLNHKRGLGLMPDVPGPGGGLAGALPLAELAGAASDALPAAASGSLVDRMDVRPDDGLVKVRFDDPEVTEVTVALADGRILHVGPRKDVFMEKLHSGEILGDGWILLSDAAAVGLLVLLATGFWLWLLPRFRA